MASFLFCTCYFDVNGSANASNRYTKWIDYYETHTERFGTDYLFLIDDGSAAIPSSSRYAVHDAHNLPARLNKRINFFHFPDNLGRSSVHEYPGWWRSFIFSMALANVYGMRKIIHIESDFFIVSDRLASYIKSVETGWTALYSQHYKFAETGIQIITSDSFPAFERVALQIQNNGYQAAGIAEKTLPFTQVNQEFVGDRFGELDILEDWIAERSLPAHVDYVGQVLPHHRLDQFKPFFTFDLS